MATPGNGIYMNSLAQNMSPQLTRCQNLSSLRRTSYRMDYKQAQAVVKKICPRGKIVPYEEASSMKSKLTQKWFGINFFNYEKLCSSLL